MSWRCMVRAGVRLGIVVSLALAGLTFGSEDAEARRGGKVRSSTHQSQDGSSSSHKPGGDGAEGARHHYTPVPRVRSRDASRGEGAAASDAGSATFRQPMYGRPPQAIAGKDIEVDGCAEGMICTVCLAGCSGDIGGIVDAQVRTPMPKPRE